LKNPLLKGGVVSIDFQKPTPLYLQIVEHIKKQINSGDYKEDDQLGSQHDLAREYDVSLITIKRAINELIKEKILYSRVGKGTYVASQLKKASFGDHFNIGLILRDLNSPYFSRIAESVEARTSELGYNLLVATSSNDPDKEDKQIKKYLDMGVHGLIIGLTTTRFHATETIYEIHHKSFPYVIISYVAETDVNYISTDHRYGAFLATEHLIKTGYKNIGYINAEKGYFLGEIRKGGYLDALQKYELRCPDNFNYRIKKRGEWHEYKSGYDIGVEVCNLESPPDAVFVYNDLTALGFERALLDNNMKIPEDIAIVGFDHIKRGQIAPVPLTTIEQPMDEIGKIAVDCVMDMYYQKALDFPIILKPTLIIRESSLRKGKKSSERMRYTRDLMKK